MAIDMRESQQSRDTTLPPDTYMYMQNIGKGGMIMVYKGPAVVTQSGQDVPVRYDIQNRKFQKSDSLESAVQQCPRANEGDYIVLENPSESGNFPKDATSQAIDLQKGRKVIIPGPWSQVLWPGQVATVVEGHRLRSNQFLIATIYNAEEAQKNWETGTVAVSQTESLNPEDKTLNPEDKAPERQSEIVEKKGLPKPDSFAVGTRIVIKGSDVSFYIPCTGVEVMKDKDSKYVRDAVTLEQLEYACLVDENGKKEYPRGPKVVFPKPTQVFEEDKKGRRKFRPIELNAINGIHLKVTTNFKGPDIETDVSKERDFREGEELFVTGKILSIYYPREELAVIEYGQGSKKHYSTAVPKGEGRYVIDREKGSISLQKGPIMLLPDPRNQILVRRILSQDECDLWYPGNTAAKTYNAELAVIMSNSPSGRSGVVSEGDVRKATLQSSALARKNLELLDEEDDSESGAMNTVQRGTRYTTPRQLTLNTKFDGVPRIEVWPGYAVLVVGSEGTRRVVQGPHVVLLEYDEKLGFMKLSTGKPKSTDNFYRTSYLCIQNNQVGDIISFESKDHVKGSVKISLRVNFEGTSEEEKLRWFSVDNYVKYLTDHVRSIIAGMAKRKSIAEIKADYVNLVREAILGAKGDKSNRPGLFFESNGMRVVEVEVLEIALSDKNIAQLLDQSQHKTVATNIEIEAAQKELEALKIKEKIEQDKVTAQAETLRFKREIEKETAAEQVELLLAQAKIALQQQQNKLSFVSKDQELIDFQKQKELARAKMETEHQNSVDTSKLTLKKQELEATTDAAVKRFNAAKEGLYEVMVALQRDDLAVKLAEGCTIERWLSGDNTMSAITNLLSMVPSLEGFLEKGRIAGEKLSKNRLKGSEAPATK